MANGSWMSTSEAARHLGVSVATIYRMEKRGELKPMRTSGRQRRYKVDSLNKLISENQSQTSETSATESATTPYSQHDSDFDADALVKDPEALLFGDNVRLGMFLDAIKSDKMDAPASHNHYSEENRVGKWIEDWDFKASKTKFYTHGLHTYPAMFIPQVARKLILEYTTEGQHIVDPFCGSGTTLVESMLLKRQATGIELNPLAVMIARAKTNPLSKDLLVSCLRKILQEAMNSEEFAPEMLPDFTNRDFWFKPETLASIGSLKNAIENLNSADAKQFFFVCLSEVIREASLTRHKEFKLFRDPRKLTQDFAPDVLELFFEKAKTNIRGMTEFFDEVTPPHQVNIIHGDAREKHLPDKSADLVLTSPPYGDSKTTVAYGQFSRLSAQWLGLKHASSIDSMLLGGKQRQGDDVTGISQTLLLAYDKIRSSSPKRAQEVLDFYIDLYQCIVWLSACLRNNGHMILIVGNRTVKDVVIRMDTILVEFAESLGLRGTGILYRNIPNKRMPSRNSPTNQKGLTASTMTRESIVILKKS